MLEQIALEDSSTFFHNFDEPEQKHNPEAWPETHELLYAPLEGQTALAEPVFSKIPSLPQVPSNVEFVGELNFNINVPSTSTSRNPWIVSIIK